MQPELLEPDQAEVVRALESGTATEDPCSLRRVDTHMSRLFLGPDRAYKLKRSRRHPFADMSTMEARRRACEAELAVNRPLAPTLCERVAPLVRSDSGTIRLGGEGEVLDWVMVMARFPDGALLSEIADSGGLTAALVDEAVEAIVDFHAALPAVANVGHAADYRRVVHDLRRTEAEGAAALGMKASSDELFQGLADAIQRLSLQIEVRRRAGFVRAGHGDLQLRNICVFHGRVTPFDALEFDPRLATTDVLYDFAFLLMDLRAHGLPSAANRAMNGYWDRSGQDESGLALLPLFMSLRAAVRMAVAVEAGDLVEAARYRRLGLQQLQPAQPRLVAIGGLSGTGKSTVARAIAPDLPGACGARLLRTDTIRKAGLAPDARLDDAAYLPDARAGVYGELTRLAAADITAGNSAIPTRPSAKLPRVTRSRLQHRAAALMEFGCGRRRTSASPGSSAAAATLRTPRPRSPLAKSSLTTSRCPGASSTPVDRTTLSCRPHGSASQSPCSRPEPRRQGGS